MSKENDYFLRQIVFLIIFFSQMNELTFQDVIGDKMFILVFHLP